IGPMLMIHRIQVWQVVEFRRSTQRWNLHRVYVVAALNVIATAVCVREVRIDRELLRPLVRPFHPHCRTVEPIMIPDERPVVIHVLAGEIERRPVGPARDRHPILHDVPGCIQLVGVIEHRSTSRKQRTPGAPTDAVSGVVTGASRRGVGLYTKATLTVLRLQVNEMVHVVERGGRAERDVGSTGVPGLCGDYYDTLPGTTAVDRA